MYFYVFINNRIIDELFVNHVTDSEIEQQIRELKSKHGDKAEIKVSNKMIRETIEV